MKSLVIGFHNYGTIDEEMELLQNIYRNRSDLVVVFLCEKYAEKQWCGLEWRAIRDLIKVKKDDQLMLVRFDHVEIDGLFSLDGYIDANVHDPKKLAEFILQRVRVNTH